MAFERTLLVALLTAMLLLTSAQPTFDQYLQSQGMSFRDPVERALREKVYNANIKKIVDSMKPPINSYGMKITKYVLWTDEQLQKIQSKSVKLPRIINVGGTQQQIKVGVGPNGLPKIRGTNAPPSLNWQTRGKVSPVKDQGDCGSCWSFSAIAAIESHLILKTNQIYNLSEQYALQCNPDGTYCGGGDPSAVLQFLLDTGAAQAKDYPYDYLHSHFGICQSSNRIYLPPNTGIAMSQNSIDQDLIDYLQLGPVLTLFSLYDMNTFKIYSNGSYTGCPTSINFSDIDHAVLVIGYDQTNWIVKNSWGTDWGMGGIALINRKQNCGIGMFNVQLQTCADGTYLSNPTLPNEYGYMMASKYISCLPCPSNCITCTSPTNCTSCPAGQYLTGGACVVSCSDFLTVSGNSCSCPNGSFLFGSSCNQCSAYCQSCTNTSVCLTCMQGYKVSMLDGQCYSSCPSNTQLTSNGVCTCLNTTYLSGQSCFSCIGNCTYCTNRYSCYTCFPGYIVNSDNSECIMCPANCQHCMSQGQCMSCQVGYLLNIFDMQCYKTCPQPYMIVQNSTCICQGNIDLTNNNCSIPCVPLCSQCSNTTFCDVCLNGSYQNTTTKNCTLCAAGCINCHENASNCSACFDGYFLDSTKGCVKCPANCTTCTSTDVCTGCVTPLTVISNVCNCATGSYFYNNTCVTQCPANMNISGNQCICSDAAAIYINGQCRNCPNLCSACNSHVYCTACIGNATLSNSTCLCNKGYYIYGTSCASCPSQCSSCTNTTICTNCSTGYKMYNGTCCKAGNWWNNSQCTPCSPGCGDCESMSACTACPSSFQLVSGVCQCNLTSYLSNGNCVKCVSPCAACTNQTYCTACVNPFLISNGVCNCPPNFVSSGGGCQTCGSGCSSCLPGPKCSSCNEAYVLINSVCVACPINCKSCINNITCSSCYPPTTLLFSKCLMKSSGNSTDNTSSSQCPSNCFLCYSSTACYQCQSTYYLTQALTCVTNSTIIWIGQSVTNVAKQLVATAVKVGASPCELAAPGNTTVSLPFITLNNVSSILVGNDSTMYVGNSLFNVSGVALTYGSPEVTYSFEGVIPNRFATVFYKLTDCMSGYANWWAAAFYENHTNSFELVFNQVPMGADRQLRVQSSGADIYAITATNGSKYLMTTGSTCTLQNTSNCGVCDSSLTNCLACTNNYSLSSNICVQTCPTNYASVDWKCVQSGTTPTPSPTPSTNSGSSTVLMWVFIGLGIFLFLILMTILIIWCCKEKGKQMKQGMMAMTVADGAQPPISTERQAVAASRAAAQPQMVESIPAQTRVIQTTQVQAPPQTVQQIGYSQQAVHPQAVHYHNPQQYYPQQSSIQYIPTQTLQYLPPQSVQQIALSYQPATIGKPYR